MPKHTHVRVYFTEEIREAILDRVAAGEPLLRVCGPAREAEMPDRQTVYAWLRKDEAFYWAFMRARRLGAAALGEEILAIADGQEPLEAEERPGLRQSFGRQVPGTMPVRAGAAERNLGRDWMRITARRWLAGVMAPRVSAGEAWREERMAEQAAEEETRGIEDEAYIAARIAAILEEARRRTIELEEGAAAGDAKAAWELEQVRAGEARALAEPLPGADGAAGLPARAGEGKGEGE